MCPVSLVDALHVRSGGAAAGEFRAPLGARRLASAALIYVGVTATFAMLQGVAVARATPFTDRAAIGVVLPVFCGLVAFIAWGVRIGRLQVDADGVAWGVGGLRFRMRGDRILVARLYRDAVAVVPRYGTGMPWYLSARDWTPWTEVARAFRRSGLPLEVHDRRAPLIAKLQGYGLALDLILVLNALIATFVAWG